ncbi:Zn-ribbon domain-containing OB-fold protein [Streptomyces sp. NPDC058457]|uniref:Zn-ribbon domain-containing OB-fold protein n=1 Tax=Streptomyces sp. NPDC058457 TaxID=3346507 RepID=UPI003651F770
MEGPLSAAAETGSRLHGSRCVGCAVAAYPARPGCPCCGGPAEPVLLSATGTLWTWTVQRYVPKSPPYVPPAAGFTPFAVGYVELPEGVRVLAALDIRPEDAEIGMTMTVAAGDGVPRATEAAV